MNTALKYTIAGLATWLVIAGIVIVTYLNVKGNTANPYDKGYKCGYSLISDLVKSGGSMSDSEQFTRLLSCHSTCSETSDYGTCGNAITDGMLRAQSDNGF